MVPWCLGPFVTWLGLLVLWSLPVFACFWSCLLFLFLLLFVFALFVLCAFAVCLLLDFTCFCFVCRSLPLLSLACFCLLACFACFCLLLLGFACFIAFPAFSLLAFCLLSAQLAQLLASYRRPTSFNSVTLANNSLKKQFHVLCLLFVFAVLSLCLFVGDWLVGLLGSLFLCVVDVVYVFVWFAWFVSSFACLVQVPFKARATRSLSATETFSASQRGSAAATGFPSWFCVQEEGRLRMCGFLVAFPETPTKSWSAILSNPHTSPSSITPRKNATLNPPR